MSNNDLTKLTMRQLCHCVEFIHETIADTWRRTDNSSTI
jgi:hypothetical protein